MPHSQVLKAEGAATRRTFRRVGALVVLAVLVIGWFNDNRSCARQVDIRRSLIENREINRDAIPYWLAQGRPEVAARLRARVKSDESVTVPNCSQLLPGT